MSIAHVRELAFLRLPWRGHETALFAALEGRTVRHGRQDRQLAFRFLAKTAEHHVHLLCVRRLNSEESSRPLARILTVLSVRLRVDAGLLLIILVSMAIGKPFTLQYARERVPEERWKSPRFARINFVITSVWALAFACIVAADLMMIYLPNVPIRVGIVVTLAALYGAYRFTDWYPKQASPT